MLASFGYAPDSFEFCIFVISLIEVVCFEPVVLELQTVIDNLQKMGELTPEGLIVVPEHLVELAQLAEVHIFVDEGHVLVVLVDAQVVPVGVLPHDMLVQLLAELLALVPESLLRDQLVAQHIGQGSLSVEDVLQTVEVNQETLLGEDHVFGAQHLVEEFFQVVASL
jgi:hypothetical protein